MLEGLANSSYWNWKDSIGPLKDRPGFSGVWDYQQTNGLGCELLPPYGILDQALLTITSMSFP